MNQILRFEAGEMCRPRITVLVSPSHVFAEGLRHLLAGSDFALDYHAVSAADVPASPAAQRLFMIAGSQLVTITEALRTQDRSCIIMALASATAREDARAALAAGADGVLDEALDGHALVSSLELLTAGHMILPLWLRDGLTAVRPAAPSSSSAARVLSERERVILGQLGQGRSNKMIAIDLDIAEATVKVHVKAILRKLGLANRTQAGIWAVQHTLPAPRAITATEAA